jgi:hypothetical protein
VVRRAETDPGTSSADIREEARSHWCDDPPGAARRWARFAGGACLILLVAFAGVPALQRWKPIAEIHDAVEASGIDATALFYTEAEVSSQAEGSIRNTMRFWADMRSRPSKVEDRDR